MAAGGILAFYASHGAMTELGEASELIGWGKELVSNRL